MNIKDLPSVSVAKLRDLPAVQAVYFIVKAETVLYVGSSRNLKVRWGAHHHKQAAIKARAKIAWLAHEDGATLKATESAMITEMSPALNQRSALGKKPYRALTMKFDRAIYDELAEFCKKHKLTITAALHMGVELWLEEREKSKAKPLPE